MIEHISICINPMICEPTHLKQHEIIMIDYQEEWHSGHKPTFMI